MKFKISLYNPNRKAIKYLLTAIADDKKRTNSKLLNIGNSIPVTDLKIKK